MIGIIVLLTASVASQAAPAAANPSIIVDAPEEKMVCKRVEEETTGSRLSGRRKVCRTESEWRAFADATARAINETKDKGLLDPTARAGGRGGCSVAASNRGRC